MCGSAGDDGALLGEAATDRGPNAARAAGYERNVTLHSGPVGIGA
jgi:hypothetical protein